LYRALLGYSLAVPEFPTMILVEPE
jgi:hypothetical protein